MLKRLTLENIAIIERLSVLFGPGLTIITGETGAGKSILIESIALALGAKASAKDLLRTGANRGRIELTIDLTALPHAEIIRQLLGESDLEMLPDEDELLISRELTATASRFRINGTPVTRELMESLRPWLVDFHAQHELSALFQSATQRACLDALGGGELLALKQTVASLYSRWQTAFKERDTLLANQEAFQARRDFIEFQLNELVEAELGDPTEDTATQAELERLMHAEKLQQNALAASQLLVEGEWEKHPALSDQLGQVQKLLADGSRVDPQLTPLWERACGLLEEVKSLAAELSHYHEQLDTDPAALQAKVDRLDRLEKLKRKYGPTLAEVIETRERLSEELMGQEAVTGNLAALTQEVSEAAEALTEATAALSQERRQLADTIQSLLEAQLQELAMPAARFACELTPCDFTPEGGETVTFLFSANPGEPLRPLAKVASGGELSRFLLALKVLGARAGEVQAMVFDEIDTGMSGAAAKSVGEKLLQLSKRMQVLVITHQPIVAAMGDHHLHVQKETHPEDERVVVAVRSLEEKEKRLQVLSRLASGIDTDDEAVEKYIQRLIHEAEAWRHQEAETRPPQKTA